MALTITCPECNAQPGNPCHNADGEPCFPHTARWPTVEPARESPTRLPRSEVLRAARAVNPSRIADVDRGEPYQISGAIPAADDVDYVVVHWQPAAILGTGRVAAFDPRVDVVRGRTAALLLSTSMRAEGRAVFFHPAAPGKEG
jgi:hypothetical protein